MSGILEMIFHENVVCLSFLDILYSKGRQLVGESIDIPLSLVIKVVMAAAQIIT